MKKRKNHIIGASHKGRENHDGRASQTKQENQYRGASQNNRETQISIAQPFPLPSYIKMSIGNYIKYGID